MVDALGLPMAVSVHWANIQNNKGAESALSRLDHKFTRLKKIIDGNEYGGNELKEEVQRMLGCKFEIVLRSDESS